MAADDSPPLPSEESSWSRQITLGMHSFGKLAIWADLDTKKQIEAERQISVDIRRPAAQDIFQFCFKQLTNRDHVHGYRNSGHYFHPRCIRRLGAVALGALLIHRYSQRAIASLLARRKTLPTAIWAAINFLICIPLIEFLRQDFDDHREPFWKPQAMAMVTVTWLALGMIYGHQIYRLAVGGLEGRGRREILFRVGALLLSVTALILLWATKAKLFPGTFTEP